MAAPCGTRGAPPSRLCLLRWASNQFVGPRPSGLYGIAHTHIYQMTSAHSRYTAPATVSGGPRTGITQQRSEGRSTQRSRSPTWSQRAPNGALSGNAAGSAPGAIRTRMNRSVRPPRTSVNSAPGQCDGRQGVKNSSCAPICNPTMDSTAAHQRQAVCAGAQAAVDGAGGMLVHAGRGGAGAGRFVDVFRPFGDRRTFKERHLLLPQAVVCSAFQVMRAGKGQPQQVVREMRAHPGSARRVPPMLHIARFKLARRAQHNLGAQGARLRPSQRHGILQLVAVARGTARLVKARFGKQA